MSEEVAEVDRRFVEWYKTIDLGDNPERVGLRWQGVENAYRETNSDTILTLCQLAFGGPRPASASLEWFEKAFKDADDEFSLADNDAELRVLAGACIVNELENAEHSQAETCLAIAAANFGGLRRFSLKLDITALINVALAVVAAKTRKRPERKAVSLTPLNLDSAVTSWSAPDQALKLIAKAIDAKLSTIGLAINSCSTVIDAQDDELQILWWLFGGQCLDLKMPFQKVPLEKRPFVFARELARCIKVAPGPTSISELLKKAGVPANGKSVVRKAISEADDKWVVEALSQVSLSPWLHPLHFAFSLRLQANEGWEQFWAGSCKVEQNSELSPIALAVQFYQEQLLIKASVGT